MRAGQHASLAAMRGALAPQALLLSATALLVGASLLRGGAAGDDSLFWIGAGAVLAAAAAVAAATVGRLPRPALGRAGWTALGLLAAFVAWNGLSIWWSTQPSRSWDFFNRGVAYFAFACLGLLLAAAFGTRALRLVAAGLAVLLALVLGWAVLGKVVPALGPDPRIARLRSPVGYWNELALLADAALVLGLWLAARRRLAGVLLAYVGLVSVVLTYSRSGIVLAVLVALGWLWLRPERYESVVALAAAGAAALGAAGVGLLLPGVSEDAAGHRGRDGALFALALVAFGVVGLLAARRGFARQIGPERRRVVVRAAAGVAVAVVVASLGAAVAQAGGPRSFVGDRWDEFTNTAQFDQGAGRVAGFSSSGRWVWWQEAWDTFLDDPVAGTGAGTFQLSDRFRRRTAVTTIEPHNTALQFLSETGIVGFGLWLGAAAAAAVAIRRRRYDDPAAAAALTLIAAACFLHSLVDIDWSFLAVQAPLFVVVGALLGAGAPVARARPARLQAAAALLVGAGLCYSLLAPWLAERRADAAVDAFVDSRYDVALERARAARSLNPLSVTAVTAEAQAEEGRGNLQEAYDLYVQAVRLEPENPDTWFTLGDFQLQTLRNARAAFDSLNQSYTLDRFGPAAEPGGLLDQARCQAFRRGPNCPARGRGARP